MIQPSELRLGNWLLLPNGITQVESISAKWADFTNGYRSDYGAIKPVGLSPELLEKAGFVLWKRTEDGDLWRNGKFTLIHTYTVDVGNANTIEITNQRAFFLHGYHNDCQIQYLHQLMNLYHSLTGEELSINLP